MSSYTILGLVGMFNGILGAPGIFRVDYGPLVLETGLLIFLSLVSFFAFADDLLQSRRVGCGRWNFTLHVHREWDVIIVFEEIVNRERLMWITFAYKEGEAKAHGAPRVCAA